MINNINFSLNNQPEFKGKFTNSIDFADKYTSRRASMYLYTGCILSRLVNSRDKYEFQETLRRDSMGLASLFFLASIFEKTSGYLIEKTDNYLKKKKGNTVPDTTPNLFLSAGSEKHELPSLFNALNPLDKKFEIRSFGDIDALKDIDENLKKSLMHKKTVLYLASLAFSIGIIGIFIPWLNTITTKKSIRDDQEIQARNSQNSMDIFLKRK